MKLVNDNTLKELCLYIKSMFEGLTDNIDIKYDRRILVSGDDVEKTVSNCYYDRQGVKTECTNQYSIATGVLVKKKYDWISWRAADYSGNSNWTLFFLCDGLDDNDNVINPKYYEYDSTAPDNQTMAWGDYKYAFICAGQANRYIGEIASGLHFSSRNPTITGASLDKVEWQCMYYISSLTGIDALKAIMEDDVEVRDVIKRYENGETDVWFNDRAKTFTEKGGGRFGGSLATPGMFIQAPHIPYIDLSKTDTGYSYKNLGCALNALSAAMPDVSVTTGSRYQNMFYNCEHLKKVTGVPTLGATDFRDIFAGDWELEKVTDGKDWDMSSALYVQNMFYACHKLDLSFVNSWDLKNVENASYMFNFILHEDSSLDLSNISFDSCKYAIGMFKIFYFKSLKLPKFSSALLSTKEMFMGASVETVEGWENLNMSSVTDMSYMFTYLSKLTEIDVSSWDTSKNTTLRSTFSELQAVTQLDLHTLSTVSVTNMDYVFSNSYNITSLDISGWDTSSVTTMEGMFTMMNALTELDISGFDMSKVTNAKWMFSQMRSLVTLTLPAEWDMINIEYNAKYTEMFFYDSALTTINGTMTNITVPLSLTYCPLDLATMQMLLNGLYDFTNNPNSLDLTVYTSHNISFKTSQYNLLSEDDIKVATDKGWTVSAAN